MPKHTACALLVVVSVAPGCGRVVLDVPDASDAAADADACAPLLVAPMAPARREAVCSQADIDAYVACAPCAAQDGGACAACLFTNPKDETWGPQVPFVVDGVDVITLPNVWECIDLLTGTTCGEALYERDMCVLAECDHGAAPPGPCAAEYEAGTCPSDALAGVCKPYDDAMLTRCAGVLAPDGGPLATVAPCFAGKGPLATVFCGTP